MAWFSPRNASSAHLVTARCGEALLLFERKPGTGKAQQFRAGPAHRMSNAQMGKIPRPSTLPRHSPPQGTWRCVRWVVLSSQSTQSLQLCFRAVVVQWSSAELQVHFAGTKRCMVRDSDTWKTTLRCDWTQHIGRQQHDLVKCPCGLPRARKQGRASICVQWLWYLTTKRRS